MEEGEGGGATLVAAEVLVTEETRGPKRGGYSSPMATPTTATPDSGTTHTPSSSESYGRPKKRRRIPYTLVEASKGNRCPTPGCDGTGHITGLYAMHYAVSGCPSAHGKTAEDCRSRREELDRLRGRNVLPSTPVQVEEEEVQEEEELATPSRPPTRRAQRGSTSMAAMPVGVVKC